MSKLFCSVWLFMLFFNHVRGIRTYTWVEAPSDRHCNTYSSNQYVTTTTVDEQACQTLCEEDDICGVFRFTVSNGQCMLMKHCVLSTTTPGTYVSKVKQYTGYEVQFNAVCYDNFYWNGIITGLAIANYNIDDCLDRCESADCGAVIVHSNTGRCDFYSPQCNLKDSSLHITFLRLDAIGSSTSAPTSSTTLGNDFVRENGKYCLFDKGNELATHTVGTIEECEVVCDKTRDCFAVSYGTVTNECKVYSICYPSVSANDIVSIRKPAYVDTVHVSVYCSSFSERILSKSNMVNIGQCVEHCRVVDGCKYASVDTNYANCYLHHACLTNLTTLERVITFEISEPLLEPESSDEILWGTNVTNSQSGKSHTANDKYLMYMKTAREIEVYEKDGGTGEYTTLITTVDHGSNLRSTRVARGESPHFITLGYDNFFHVYFATNMSPLTYTKYSPGISTSSRDDSDVKGYISVDGTFVCFNYRPRVRCYTCNPLTASCTQIQTVVPLRRLKNTELISTGSSQSKFGDGFDIIESGFNSQYLIAVAEMSGNTVGINHDGALFPDMYEKKPFTNIDFLQLYRYDTISNSIYEYTRIPTPDYSVSTDFGHVVRFTDDGGWLFVTERARGRMYIYKRVSGDMFELDKSVELPQIDDHALYLSPTGDKFIIAFTGRFSSKPSVYEYHYNSGIDSYELKSWYGTTNDESVYTVQLVGTKIYSGSYKAYSNMGFTDVFSASVDTASVLPSPVLSAPTSPPTLSPREYVTFTDKTCTQSTNFIYANDKTYTAEMCKELCDQYRDYCFGALRLGTSCFLYASCNPSDSNGYEVYIPVPPQVKRVELPTNTTQCFLRHAVLSTSPGVLALAQRDSPDQCPEVCNEYPETQFFMFHETISFPTGNRPGCVCQSYCHDTTYAGNYMPFFFMDTASPTRAPTPIDFAPPTRRPTRAPTPIPTPAPTDPIPCTTSGDCVAHSMICAKTGFCKAVSCTAHTDCFADTQTGRLPYCNFKTSLCVDVATSTCTTQNNCLVAAQSYAVKNNAVTSTSLTNNINVTSTRNAATVQTLQALPDSGQDVTVDGSESITLNITDTSPEALQAIKEARCGEYADLCELQVVNRRILQSGGSTVDIILTYTVDDAVFQSWVSGNTTFDSSTFVTTLAQSLNISEQEINVITESGNVVVTIALVDTYGNGEAIDQSTITTMETIQSSLTNITQDLVTSLNLDQSDITATQANLCGNRDCSGRGTCNTSTGVCTCSSPAYYGINCELTTLSPTKSPSVSPTSFPTAAPVVLPTSSPTTAAVKRETVTKYSVTISSDNHTLRDLIVQDALQTVITTLPATFNIDYKIGIQESVQIPGAVYNADSDKDYLIGIMKGFRGFFRVDPPVGAVFAWDPNLPNRRLLQSLVNLQATYELTSEQYTLLGLSGDQFDSEDFATQLEQELGLAPGSVSISYQGYDLEITFVLEHDTTDPMDETFLQTAADLKTTVDDAVSQAATTYGLPPSSLTYSTFDLCADRTTTYPGCLTCDSSTGVCSCDVGWVGTSCHIPLVCENDGVMTGNYCQCPYPYYGIFCESTVDCSCAAV